MDGAVSYEALQDVNIAIGNLGAGEVGRVSDGYHTFNELYDHRRALTAGLGAALAQLHAIHDGLPPIVWRSRAHHPDGDPIFEGYFIVGLVLGQSGTITYHYANQYWDDFKAFRELPHAPKWDGAPPSASVTRLIDWARS